MPPDPLTSQVDTNAGDPDASDPAASPDIDGSADGSADESTDVSTDGNVSASDGVARMMSTAVAEPTERVDRTEPSAPHGAPPPSKILPGESGDDIFNRLILPEMEIMWRVALSLTRNRADAEDVVQEALLRAYRAIHTFDGRYPRAWVLTILRNTEHNRHRRKRPPLLNDPDSVEERGPATEADAVEQYAEDREFDQAVVDALAKLPDNFRQVVELVDIDGLAYQEAADVLDVPLGTVMSRLHRARRRIRELLVPLGYGPHGHSDHRADPQPADAASADAKTTIRLEEQS